MQNYNEIIEKVKSRYGKLYYNFISNSTQTNLLNLESNLFENKIIIFFSPGAGGNFLTNKLNELCTESSGEGFKNKNNEYIGNVNDVVNCYQYHMPWIAKDNNSNIDLDLSQKRKEKVIQQLIKTRYVICIKNKNNEWTVPAMLFLIKKWLRYSDCKFSNDMKPTFLKPIIKKYIKHNSLPVFKKEYSLFVQQHKNNPENIWQDHDYDPVNYKQTQIIIKWLKTTLLKYSIKHIIVDYNDLFVNPTQDLCKQLIFPDKSEELRLKLKEYHKKNLDLMLEFLNT